MGNHAAFKAFEKITTSFTMWKKMLLYLFLFVGIMHISINLYLVYSGNSLIYGKLNTEDISQLKSYYKAKVLKNINITGKLKIEYNIKGHNIKIGVSKLYNILESEKTIRQASYILESNIKRVFVSTSAIYLLIPLLIFLLRIKHKSDISDKHLRGLKLTSPERLRDSLASKGKKSRFRINENIILPIDYELQHFHIQGKSGSGKTQFTTRLIEQIIKDNMKTVIYDIKGDYIQKYYNPKTDFIWNPVDKRCVGWDFFNDIKTEMDITTRTSSLIEQSTGDQKYWNNAARDVFEGILYYCIQTDQKTNAKIWELVNLDIETLVRTLQSVDNTETALRHLRVDAKASGDIMSVLSEYTKCFKYLQNMTGDFSIIDWVKDDNAGGRLFVCNYASIKEIMKPIITLFIDTVARGLLDLNDDSNRRLFFILDEFGTLQKMPAIIDLLTLSRSKGGSVVVMFQDNALINEIYGNNLTKTIINNTSTKVLFGAQDPETAEFCSNLISSREIRRTDESRSMGVDDMKDSISSSDKIITEKLVLPAEFMKLEDLNFYIKIPGEEPCKDKIVYKSSENKHDKMQNIDDISLGKNKLKGKKIEKKEEEIPKKEVEKINISVADIKEIEEKQQEKEQKTEEKDIKIVENTVEKEEIQPKKDTFSDEEDTETDVFRI